MQRAQNRVRHLAAVIESIYAAAHEPQRWQVAIDQACALMHGRAALLFSSPSDAANGSLWIGSQLTASDLDTYKAHYHTVDGWVATMQRNRIPSDVVVVGQQLVPVRTFRHSEFFCDFLRPLDILHLSTAHLASGVQAFFPTYFSAYRSLRGAPFTSLDVLLHSTLVSHIRRALTITATLERLRRTTASLLRAFDAQIYAIFLVDGNGQLIEANARARSLLHSDGAISLGQGSLLRLRGSAGVEFMTWLRDGAPSTGDGLLYVPRRGRAPLLVVPSPMVAEATFAFPYKTQWMLVVFDPEASLELNAGLIGKALDISEREAQVAALFYVGHNFRTIGIRLGLKEGTIRTHVKNVFRKTGIRSQAELMRRLTICAGLTAIQARNSVGSSRR